ncbi:hypothetical protein RCL1_009117 [Eukaryota sp. TZLM3-RCL]
MGLSFAPSEPLKQLKKGEVNVISFDDLKTSDECISWSNVLFSNLKFDVKKQAVSSLWSEHLLSAAFSDTRGLREFLVEKFSPPQCPIE